MDKLPLAFDVPAVRAAMLEGIIIPREMVNDSLRELHEQIKAEKTFYFQKNGKVVDKRTTADNGARLQAIDQTLSLAGLYKPDDRRNSSPSVPNFSIEVTPAGVIRIAVGSSPAQLTSAPTPEISLPLENEPTVIQTESLRASRASRDNHSIDETVKRFNTILDEIVDD